MSDLPDPRSGPSEAGGAAESPAVPRRGRVVAVVAVVVLVAAAVAAVVAVREPADDTTSRRTTADESPPPGSDTTSAQSASEADLAAVVADISAFVERQRGLTFAHPVEVELLADAEFQGRLLDDFEEEVDEIEETEVVYRAFGLMDGDGDLVGAMRKLLGAGVVGFYDPETDELAVRGARLSPYVRTTIAHELTHALDDQHLDLDRPEYDDADDEVGFGFSAIVEGNARRVEGAYLESLSEDDQTVAAREELSVGAGVDLNGIPLALVEAVGAPYQFGPDLVDTLLDDGGRARLDAAFARPPRTSEQVLHPERFLAGEGAVDVTLPAADGEVVVDGLMGELLVYQVLAEALGAERAAPPASGWGGDWLVAWRDGGRSCASVNIVGDSANETADLRTAFGQWAGSHAGAAVDSAPGGDVAVTTCG